MNKTFFDLTDKDAIYFINPFNQEIQGLKIKEIKGCKDPQFGPRAVLITVFRSEAILHSPDIEAVVTQDFVFPGDEQMAITMVKIENMGDIPVPVIYSATRECITQWKQQTK